MEEKACRILLITLSENSYGGVVSYNNGMLKMEKCFVKEFRNTSGKHNNIFIKCIYFVIDCFRLICVLFLTKINIVHINPSLNINSILRDSLFTIIAKLFNKKVLIQWHGWNPENEKFTKGIYLRWLKVSFFKADHTKFLYKELSKKYRELGYIKKITLGKTFIDFQSTDFKEISIVESKKIQILYLSTISKNKGIYDVIDLFRTVRSNCNDIELKVAGVGPEYMRVKDLTKNDDSITMLGFVDGTEKKELFKNSDIYLFASEHEGMPISVLEAMFFGLPILTTNVGALNDFFEHGAMGYMSEKHMFNQKMKVRLEELISNFSLRKKIGLYNNKFAQNNFMLNSVLSNIEIDYKLLKNE